MGRRRGKLFLRKVMEIVPSAKLTKRRNPVFYRYEFICGHTKYEHHQPSVVIDLFCLEKGLEIKRNCNQCRIEESKKEGQI